MGECPVEEWEMLARAEISGLEDGQAVQRAASLIVESWGSAQSSPLAREVIKPL